MPHLMFLLLAGATAGVGLMILKGEMQGQTAQEVAATTATEVKSLHGYVDDVARESRGHANDRGIHHG
jgi:type IV secretory pathway VirB6-like protein